MLLQGFRAFLRLNRFYSRDCSGTMLQGRNCQFMRWLNGRYKPPPPPDHGLRVKVRRLVRSWKRHLRAPSPSTTQLRADLYPLQLYHQPLSPVTGARLLLPFPAWLLDVPCYAARLLRLFWCLPTARYDRRALRLRTQASVFGATNESSCATRVDVWLGCSLAQSSYSTTRVLDICM